MKYKITRVSGLHWIKSHEAGKERRKLYPSDANYYPLKRLPQSELFYTAEACFQVALDHSEHIRAIFTKVVNAWEHPGCFLLMSEEFEANSAHIGEWLASAITYDNRNADAPMPSFGELVGIDKAKTYNENTDYRYLGDCVNELIIQGFNRKIDLDNKKPKVLPEKAPNLIAAITMRSLIAYLELDLAVQDKARLGEEGRIIFSKTGCVP